jgi:hypothetical protein
MTDRTGGLFQRPFKRKRIETQEYLKHAIYYIHRNPMHHRLAVNPDEYTFSSYHAMINNHPTFLKRELVLDWFDGADNFVDFHKMQFALDEAEFFDGF